MIALVLTIMLVVIGWPQLAGMQPLEGYPHLMELQWPLMALVAVGYILFLKMMKRLGFWNLLVGVPIAALSGVYGYALYNAYDDESPVRYKMVEIARARETNGSKVGCSMMVVPRGKFKPVWSVPLTCGQARVSENYEPGTPKRLLLRSGKLGVEWIVGIEPYHDPVEKVHH
jgi:hypothetical protein